MHAQMLEQASLLLNLVQKHTEEIFPTPPITTIQEADDLYQMQATAMIFNVMTEYF